MVIMMNVPIGSKCAEVFCVGKRVSKCRCDLYLDRGQRGFCADDTKIKSLLSTSRSKKIRHKSSEVKLY